MSVICLSVAMSCPIVLFVFSVSLKMLKMEQEFKSRIELLTKKLYESLQLSSYAAKPVFKSYSHLPFKIAPKGGGEPRIFWTLLVFFLSSCAFDHSATAPRLVKSLIHQSCIKMNWWGTLLQVGFKSLCLFGCPGFGSPFWPKNDIFCFAAP